MSIYLIYIIHFFLLLGIAFGYARKYQFSELKRHFWPAALFKIGCGLMLGLLFYNYYGSGDTIRYYDEASDLAALNFNSFYDHITTSIAPSEPVRAIYFVRLVAVMKWLTQADYWILSAYFSLFSFLGSFYFADKLTQWKSDLRFPSILAFLYFPSLVFWSSGLLKESLVFGALSLLIGTFISWYQNRKWSTANLLIVVLALIIIITFKYYIAAAIIPLLIYLASYQLFFWERWGIQGLWKKSGILLAVFSIPMLFFFSWMSPNLNYGNIWLVMQQNHDSFIELNPEGAVHLLIGFGNVLDVLINLPYLWFSGIFRPLFGENFSFPVVLSGIENTLFCAGFFVAVYQFFVRKMKWSAELLTILIYISMLSIFLSFSAPNFGTLSRFKIYYAPFLVMLVAYQLQSLRIFSKD